jgi:uncharacterized protein
MFLSHKKKLFPTIAMSALLLVSLVGCAPKKTIAGDWSGPIEFNNPLTGGKISLHLTIHVAQDDNGTYNGTIDVPEQKANGMKLDSITVKDSDVTMALNLGQAHATYTGKIDAAYSKITGNWSQGGLNIPLELTKDSDKTTASGTVDTSGKK